MTTRTQTPSARVLAIGLKNALEKQLNEPSVHFCKTKGKHIVAIEYMSVENKSLRNALRKYAREYGLARPLAVNYWGKTKLSFEVYLEKVAEVLGLSEEWVEEIFARVLEREIELTEKIKSEQQDSDGAGSPAPARTQTPAVVPQQTAGGENT